ncbi:MAG TPA: hypothetical protein VND64_20450, partial [Pirellulales bacterium]|nr:hypothetical protein [Pirellulales bacterium]
FLALIAVIFFVVVAAVLCGRNRGALGVLGAGFGFGAMALAGGCNAQMQPATLVEAAPAVEIKLGETAVAQAPNSKTQAPPESPKPEAEAPLGSTAGNARPATEGAASGSPTPRPPWMDEPQGKHASDGAYHKIASVELYRSRTECEEALPAELRKAVKQYIDQFLGDEGAAELVALPVSDIHEHLIRGQWEEHTSDVLGPIVNLHTQLVFDAQANADIKERYQKARVAQRLTTTGVGAGLLLGLLGTVFGYLKLDTLTRGYYSRRLQFTAGSVILTLAAIVALFAQGKLGF